MASPAHCLFCFECLAASFKNREPPSLAVVEDLWEAFESSKELALQPNLQDTADHYNNDDVQPSAAADAQADNEEVLEDATVTANPPQKAQLPSISRLQGDSSSHSSSTSTPSALSNSSSCSALTGASSTTSISPRPSSLFSRSKGTAAGFQTDTADMTYPLFVTWNTLSSNGHKSLRGCIGTFEPQELAAGLKSYALTSAFGDTRFSPIPSSLLPSLSCSLTLLSTFEPCSDALDWILGTHGLRISFIHRGRRFGATYLPDVAVEQGWTKEETVESLMRKAGWDGHGSSVGGRMTRRLLRGGMGSGGSASNASGRPWEEVSEFKAIRYQGLKASAAYAEWQEWRAWVESSAARRELLESGM
ncbi:hypothetical protein AJ79_04337 [Helicocarpus griseus UAMH5409]|uniref:AMMECR1 domain-containing protein n=1 Tax=Helicocarpus griseus UAMH5409 TaxID=1447875 RepID=A0A2B7XTV1_9EURO|nr:hypothetical protein AJ79_04337 [Helicocarpus griseus UAMH5409]